MTSTAVSSVSKKIVPCAPVVLWAAPTTKHFSHRDDWRAGRSFQDEETRCGMLCRLQTTTTTTTPLLQKSRPFQSALSSSSSTPSSSTSLSTAIVPSSRRRRLLHCVIKAQSSDVLLNEVQANGDVAVIQPNGAPKGKWKKTDRRKSFLIEEDSTESFADPDKQFSPRTMNEGRYLRRIGKVPAATPLLPFTLYRDTHSIESVQNRLFYETGIQEAAVELAQTSGGFGCVTQAGLGIGVSRELLPHASRHYSMQPLLFYPSEAMAPLSDLPRLSQVPRGNLCKVLLRCVDGSEEELRESMDALACDGFVNYFSLERFGVAGAHGFEMAAAAYTRRDYVQACGMFLQSQAERNRMHHEMFLRYVNAADGLAGRHLAAEWHQRAVQFRTSRHMLRVLKALSETDLQSEASTAASFGHVWNCIDPHWGPAARHSGAEFVWNAMASSRLLNRGRQVVVGDLVRVRASSSGRGGGGHGDHVARGREGEGLLWNSLMLQDYDPSLPYEVRRVSTAAEAARYDLSDVVLPVPYVDEHETSSPSSAELRRLYPELPGVCDAAAYQRFAQSHGLSYLFPAASGSNTRTTTVVEGGRPQQQKQQQHNNRCRTFDAYRPLIVRPEHLQYRMLRDPNSYTALKSDLFLSQERAPLQSDLTTLCDRRIREPCVYNVSERYVERMKPVLEAAQHRLRKNGVSSTSSSLSSVVVSCVLPRGSHYSMMLRESFEVSHAQFYDLLEMSW